MDELTKEVEHKPAEDTAPVTTTLNDTIDKAMESFEASKTAPETPKPQSEATDGSVPAPQPGETPADYEGIPKGFETHPSWLKREEQFKKAKSSLEKRENLLKELLKDQSAYSAYLKLNGYSEEAIKNELKRAGFEISEPKTNSSGKHSMAESVCKRLGWSWERLSNEERAYVNDLASFTDALVEEKIGPMVDKRVGKVESFINQEQRNRTLDKELADCKSLAKEDFPDLDWDKDIEKAMHTYLDTLEQSDPQKANSIGAKQLYGEVAIKLFRERVKQGESKKVREGIKATAKPLTPGTQVSREATTSLKGNTVGETFDNTWKALGLK